jgi:hypothetical protein
MESPTSEYYLQLISVNTSDPVSHALSQISSLSTPAVAGASPLKNPAAAGNLDRVSCPALKLPYFTN